MFTHLSDFTSPHSHALVADARECEAQAMEARYEYDAEMAVERYLEQADWAEHAAFEDYERRMGKVSYEEDRDRHMAPAS
jgi:hypothetical protein